MNQVEKPIKPSWFVIVETLISVVLLLAIAWAWSGLSSLLQRIGIPPLVAMLMATAILGIGSLFVLRRGK